MNSFPNRWSGVNNFMIKRFYDKKECHSNSAKQNNVSQLTASKS